jgi:hypothetical protein
MMGKKEKRIIGLVVGLVILAGAMPSLMAKPPCSTKIGAPATKEKDPQNPFLFFPSMRPTIIGDMITTQIIGESETGKIIRTSAEIIILRPSGKD